MYKTTEDITNTKSKLEKVINRKDKCKLKNEIDKYHIAHYNEEIGFNSFINYTPFKGNTLISELNINYTLIGAIG